MIERIWDVQKNDVGTYHFAGASKETIAKAKATLVQSWEDIPQDLIDERCNSFRLKLERIIAHGGNNNFEG